MTRCEVLKAFLDFMDDHELALFTTGKISREAFQVRDRLANFYMVGSMGLLSSVALGLSLNVKSRIFVFDGDGSFLMNLGAMVMITAEKPGNLVHVVIDNRVYGSTGNQPTLSDRLQLDKLARSAGYPFVFKVDQLPLLKDLLNRLPQSGPIFIHAEVDTSSIANVQRIPYDPPEIVHRFQRALKITRTRA